MMDNCPEVSAAFKVRCHPLPASNWPVFKWVKLRVGRGLFKKSTDSTRWQSPHSSTYRLYVSDHNRGKTSGVIAESERQSYYVRMYSQPQLRKGLCLILYCTVTVWIRGPSIENCPADTPCCTEILTEYTLCDTAVLGETERQ
jgi:hypothetical protein